MQDEACRTVIRQSYLSLCVQLSICFNCSRQQDAARVMNASVILLNYVMLYVFCSI